MPMSALTGNRALKEQLLPRLTDGTLGHAFILSGPAGSGKSTLAAILSRAMVCRGAGIKPCGSCPDCKKALAGIHPDIIVIAPPAQGKQVVVDQVRRLRSDAYIRPNEASRKVYIIEQADWLNDSAQNAMLKLLEEGPGYAAFLLLSENPGSLLPTIRSRCETLTLVSDCAGAEDELVQKAGEVCRLWLAGREAELMELCIPMDKWDRPQFLALAEQMAVYLSGQLAGTRDRRRVLKGIQLAQQLQQATLRNVSPGTLSGWLCAACGER